MWCYTLRLVGWVKCVGKENWTWWQLISRRNNPQNDQYLFKMAQVFSFLSIGFVYVSTITFVMEVNTYNKKWPKRTHLYYNIPGNPWGWHLYWKGYKEQFDQQHKGQLGKLVSSFSHFTLFTKDFQAEATGCYTIGGQVNLSKSRLLMVSFKSSRDYSTDISCFICFLLQYSSDILHVWVRHETDCMPK